MCMRHIAGSNIFFPITSNGTIFEKKKVIGHAMCYFSLQILSETFLVLRRIVEDMIQKIILIFMQSTRYSCQILMKLEFSRRIFEKYTKFHENPSSSSPVVPSGRADGRTDRHNEANSRFSQFCKCV